MLKVNYSNKRLKECVDIIKSTYKNANIPFTSNKGLAGALKVCEEKLKHDRNPSLYPNNRKFLKSKKHIWQNVSAVWRLGDSFKKLGIAGIDFSEHLKPLKKAASSLVFGRKERPETDDYKNFEFEILIAAELSTKLNYHLELGKPGDDFDIILDDNFILECKHPSSPKKVSGYIHKFGEKLRNENKFGALLIAMEDICELGHFNKQADLEACKQDAEQRMDLFISKYKEGLEKNLNDHPEILQIFFLASAPIRYLVNEETRFSFSYIPAPGPTNPIPNSNLKEILNSIRHAFSIL